MKPRAFFCLLLVVGVSLVGSGPAAAQTGWMQPGVRVWYLGGAGGAINSSNAEEAYLIESVNGTTASVVHHSALTHWTAPKPVDTASYTLTDMGPCWIHPTRLQNLQMGDYWMGNEITLIVRSTTYASLQYQLLPAKALIGLNPQRPLVKISYMIPGFSTGVAYFDADTGILLYYNNISGGITIFFILAEINYNFAQQTAFAEDDGPHTGFKSFAVEASLGHNWVGGGSVSFQSLVETRYAATVEMRVLWSWSASMGSGMGDENYCFFGDVPLVTHMDATQAPNFPPEQWNPFGQYLWWWLPPGATGAQALARGRLPATGALENINVFNVPMTKTADSPLTYTATQTPNTFHFSALWFDNRGYMSAFAAKGPGGLDLKPSDDYFENHTTVDGRDYFLDHMALPPPANPPTVTAISPAIGSTHGGTAVTITGTSFVTGATVSIGGVAATSVVVVNPTTVTATTPAHTPGLVGVVVTNPDAQSGTLLSAFGYMNPAAGFGLSFDNDVVADVSVYRPSGGDWYLLQSTKGFDSLQPLWYRFGEAADQPLMGDFDGDGKRDVAVYRPASGTWFWLKSAMNGAEMDYKGWGVQADGDTPAPGDYDGDGKTDLCVFRPATGTWFILESHAGYTTWQWFGWGTSGDTLVPADYDGDGMTDAAIYRPSTGVWYVRPSSGATPWSVTFGQAGDIPVRGDFDGDLKADIAVYRPSSGTWFWLKSSANNTDYGYQGWGVDALGDQPVPGDYDGDGQTDLCVFRPQYGTWFVLLSSTGNTQYAAYGWGTVGDVPLGGQR